MTINFKPTQAWSYQGRDIRFERFIDEDLLHFTDQRTLTPFLVDSGVEAPKPPTMRWALEAYASGKLIRLSSLVESAARKLAVKREYDGEEIRKKDKFAILRRYVVSALDRLGVLGGSDARLNQVVAGLWSEAPDEVRALNIRPHPRSVRRWLAERGAPGERLLKQMMSQSGRVARAPRLDSIVRDKLNELALLYWADPSKSIGDMYARLFTDIEQINVERTDKGQAPLRCPSKETLRKLIRALEGFDTYKARFGDKLAKLRFEGCGEGLRADRFLELGCMDAIPADVWDQQRLKHGIDVIADARQLEKMAGAVERGRRVSRAGVQFLGLQYHDKDRTSELLNDFATVAPRSGSGRGARSYVTKIKYNPANLSEIHVWNDRRNRYVTLPCVDSEYAAGLSKKQHELIGAFAAQRNEAFSSKADRLRMRDKLSRRIEQAFDGKVAKNRAAMARLAQSPAVQELIPNGVVLALEDQDGLPVAVIENDTLGAHRNDGGRLSKRPPRGGAKRSAKTKPKGTSAEGAPTDDGPQFGNFSIRQFKSFGQ